MKSILFPNLTACRVESSEFYRRELELEPEFIDPDCEEPLPENSLVYCSDVNDWSRRLLRSKPSSVTLILGANEYYDVEQYHKINQYKSIKFAFIEMWPNVPLRLPFKEIVTWIKQNPNQLLERNLWGTLKGASTKYLGLKKVRLNVTAHRMPLGYSNRFVNELQILGVLGGNSIMPSLMASNLQEQHKPLFQISFMGQKGSYLRRHLTCSFSKIPNNYMQLYDSWGGDSVSYKSTSYVETLLKSKFVLCPPGNWSSETWRYGESIICGAIPIITEVSIQDWTRHSYWPKTLGIPLSTCEDLWGTLSLLDDHELLEVRNVLRFHLQSTFLKTKRLMQTLIS